MKTVILPILLVTLGCTPSVEPKTFRVASYNVENLFDLTKDGTEYTAYIPNTGYGWDKDIVTVKIANIAEVIKDLRADVVALQEVESENVLILLQSRLRELSVDYPYIAISGPTDSAVRCAVLSMFPIVGKAEIETESKFTRNILKVILDIEGRSLVVYINHWRSKRGPESLRVACARPLKDDIDRLPDDGDFILIGDFNSNYNEYETFRMSARFNDTGGITGINHVLKTVKDSQMVDEQIVATQPTNEYLYNTWLEVHKGRRWTYNFFGNKNSLDNIIVSKGLYDDKGVSYVDNSFDKFDPDYLFKGNALYRWQRAKGGRGKHLGEGYSDHLPIFASFSTKPFRFDESPVTTDNIVPQELEKKVIADLYASNVGNVNYRLEHCAVIYKSRDHAVIKQRDGRAIFIYRAAADLKYGNIYHLTVSALSDYYGLREITGIDDVSNAGQADNISHFLLRDSSVDFAEPILQNEIISEVKGIYRSGYFYYGNDLKIKIYFKDKTLVPKNKSEIVLKRVRIGYYNYPQIVIEKKGQIL